MRLGFLIALAAGTAAPLLALADDGSAPALSPGEAFALSVPLVGAVVEIIRRFAWRVFDDGSDRAKLLTMALAVAVAVGLALSGLVPPWAVVPGAHPLAAKVAGGVMVASLTAFFRSGAKRTASAVRRKPAVEGA